MAGGRRGCRGHPGSSSDWADGDVGQHRPALLPLQRGGGGGGPEEDPPGETRPTQETTHCPSGSRDATGLLLLKYSYDASQLYRLNFFFFWHNHHWSSGRRPMPGFNHDRVSAPILTRWAINLDSHLDCRILWWYCASQFKFNLTQNEVALVQSSSHHNNRAPRSYICFLQCLSSEDGSQRVCCRWSSWCRSRTGTGQSTCPASTWSTTILTSSQSLSWNSRSSASSSQADLKVTSFVFVKHEHSDRYIHNF